MKLISFAGFVYPNQNAEDSFPLSFRDNAIPLKKGSFDPEGKEAYLEALTLTKRFILTATETETTDEQFDRLKRRVFGRGVLLAQMDDGSYRQVQAKTTGLSYEKGYGLDHHLRPIVHTMRADYPFWLSTNDLGWNWGEGAKLWADGLPWGSLTYTALFGSSPHTFTIDTSPGTAPILRGTITITCQSGGISNIRIDNARNSYYLQWNGTLLAGDVLTITLLSQQIKKNGASAYAQLTVPATQLEWMRLEVEGYLQASTNPITITANIAGTTEIRWQYARHF